LYWRIETGEIVSCKMATVDHLKEISQGGGNESSNLVPSCGSCNWRRSGDPEKFRKRMLHHPFYKGQS
jgi:5-methylcytosine-specific restriction endonuclease McrA